MKQLVSRPALNTSAFRRKVSTVMLLAYVACAISVFLRILQLTHGHFTYTLDDPYIHLALAERIRHGFYGLNAGEPASPSSSVLWPFLLVPFAGTAVLQYVPLVFNLLLGCVTAWLLGSVIDRYVQLQALPLRERWLARILGVLLLVLTNLVGLTFTGLEQLLETLLCVGCAFVLIHTAEQTRVPRWCLACAVVLPMVRYEGWLITLATALVLVSARRWKLAVVILACAAVPVALFSLFLHRLGLPSIPISVLVKRSMIAGDEGGLRHLFSTARGALRLSLSQMERFTILMLAVISVGAWTQVRQKRRTASVLLAVAAVAMVQVLFGPFGWFYRYEVYCISFAAPVLLACSLGRWDRSVEDMPSQRTAWDTPALGTLCLLVVIAARHYAPGISDSPITAQATYRQQGQMSHLTTDLYRAPVAVNDLGLVSFQRTSRQYVLDLMALGSPEVQQTPFTKRDAAWLASIVHRHNIGLVALYPEWFPKIPQTWTPVAKLCTVPVPLGPAFPRVMFYQTPDADSRALHSALQAWKASQLPGSTIDLNPRTDSTSCSL